VLAAAAALSMVPLTAASKCRTISCGGVPPELRASTGMLLLRSVASSADLTSCD
jgi:hypothetical protein